VILPIHREFGGDRVGYFNILDKLELVEKIEKIEREGIQKDLILKGNFRWIGWFESAQMLLSKVEKIKKVSLKVKKGDIDRLIAQVVSENRFQIKDVYEYRDFYKFDDRELIEYIYIALLKREVDEEALNSRLERIRTGKISKMELITAVRASREGRVQNIKLLGFYKRLIITLIFKSFSPLAYFARKYDYLENKLYLSNIKLKRDIEDNIREKENLFKNFKSKISRDIDRLEDTLKSKVDIEDIRGLYKEFLNYRDNILNRDLDTKEDKYKIVN